MAKKKKPQPQQPLSPSKYIRLKGRTLPIAVCYISGNWQHQGIAHIVVARQHQSGNFTIGNYLVDIFCLGVKDADSRFNIPPEELDELADHLFNCTEITYNEVHNIIYGALAFAKEEADIEPHPDFELAQYLLEEDTDEIPLIEYEFGKNGKPFLCVKTPLEASRYLPKLQERYGKDIPYLIRDDDNDAYNDDNDAYDDYEELDEELDEYEGLSDEERAIYQEAQGDKTVLSMLASVRKIQKDFEKAEALTHTTYAYAPPPYPTALMLVHNELKAIYTKKYYFKLPRRVIIQLLDLPRETLIADLNQIILYELGKSNGDIHPKMYEEYCNTITHALFLLGELKATESLQTVLEILRQDYPCLDFHFSDSRIEVLCPTLYYIGRNQTDELMAFMKEPGLDCFLRSDAVHVLTFIGMNEPQRRGEIIEWFRQLLRFLITNVSDSAVYDATLAGTLMLDLIDLHATELLPEIKELCDIEQIDLTCCGPYEEIEQEILESQQPLGDYTLHHIYQRYQQYEATWDY